MLPRDRSRAPDDTQPHPQTWISASSNAQEWEAPRPRESFPDKPRLLRRSTRRAEKAHRLLQRIDLLGPIQEYHIEGFAGRCEETLGRHLHGMPGLSAAGVLVEPPQLLAKHLCGSGFDEYHLSRTAGERFEAERS